MQLEQWVEFLGCMSVIHIGLLLSWFLVVILFKDKVYAIHSRWFRIPKERYDAINYVMIGMYKLGIFMFILIPYIALKLLF